MQLIERRMFMAKSWDGYDIVCDCGSENVDYLDDENNYLEDYEVLKCNNCGKKIRIELPN
jgi:DNA-directed RNA polymerase subunit RPC12/RpoP